MKLHGELSVELVWVREFRVPLVVEDGEIKTEHIRSGEKRSRHEDEDEDKEKEARIGSSRFLGSRVGLSGGPDGGPPTVPDQIHVARSCIHPSMLGWTAETVRSSLSQPDLAVPINNTHNI